MSKAALLHQYKNDVTNLRKCAKELGLSDTEINKLFNDGFRTIRKEDSSKSSAHNYFYNVLKCSFYTVLLLSFVYILLNVHQPTTSIVLRNVQGLIHPGFKILRALSVPIITRFPSLTGLYDESCLVENPYFYVSDMECWPCENIHSVINLTGIKNHSLYQTAAPFIVKTEQKEVSFPMLQHLYYDNQVVFDANANSIISSNQYINNLSEVFSSDIEETKSFIWRINRMLPARLIRELFPRPFFISEWSGQSIERFLFFDGNKSSAYPLPNTECSYIVLIQGVGERRIVLKPSNECEGSCKTISVVLKQSHVLRYNWWYWRPISLPTNTSSITYMSSYC